MKTYTIHVIPKRPAWDDKGAEYTILAPTKAKAISEARKMVAREGVYDRLAGPLIYTGRSAE